MSVLTTALAGAAGVALAGCLWQIGTRLRSLESQRHQAPSLPETPAASGKRSSKPMLGALYAEQPASPLSELTSLPGGAWLGAALALGVVAVGLSGFTPSKSAMDAPKTDSTLVKLQGRVDSLSQVVTQLRDSMQVGLAAGAVPAANNGKSKPEPASKVGKAPARPSGGVLAAPPPPVGTPAP